MMKQAIVRGNSQQASRQASKQRTVGTLSQSLAL
jgi:hypothetical protein